MYNVLLTGAVHVGKTTLIRRLLAKHPEWRVGGFVTLCEGMGVHLLPAAFPCAPRTAENLIGRRYVPRALSFPHVFDTLGVELVQSALHGCDLILMDELGFLESAALRFQQAVLEALASEVPVLAIVKPAHTPFLDGVRACADVPLFSLTPENRDAQLESVDAALCRFLHA